MTELADKFEFVVRWEPFFLRPDTPLEGIPKPASNADPNNPRVQYLVEAGKSVGCDFTMKCKIFPNTQRAHALMEYAKNQDDGIKQNDVAEALFKAYFTDGYQPDENLLLDVARKFGFDTSEVKSYINDDTVIQSVKEKAKNWKAKGVTGVPYFFINGQRMFSGAQDADVFMKMFERVAEKFPISRG